MKREIFFEKFSKKSKIDEQKKITIIARKRFEKTKRKNETKKQTRHQKKSKKTRHQMNLKSKTRQKRKQNFFFALDKETKKHRHRNIETINNNRHKINKIIFFDK